ncbi:hypothetical protein B0H13DRAFT_2667945 [Mycena leptocephala]|nr:hypothetical protein B0H13DRAFT_2667945 [Mycena leptocephala]
MLLGLLLAHVFAKNHHSGLAYPLDSREELVSCDDIRSCRTLFSIVSDCLLTIFACTWVSVHPNVPPPNHGQLALSWRRFRLMLVDIIAPELMVGFAARQFLDAWWFSKKYDVSTSHGFFFTMGGFVSRNGMIPLVEDIQDKSKGDVLSKGVALIQGLWFMAQCLARVHQRIPLTELEVATLAFQFLTIFVWLLWWNKPLDVQQPILVGVGNEVVTGTPPRHEGLLEVVMALFLGAFPDFDPESSTSTPSFWSTHGTNKQDTHLISIAIQTLVGTVFGAIHCAAWNATFPSSIEMWLWRSCSVAVAVLACILTLVYVPMVVFDSPVGWTTLDVTFIIAVVVYIAARLILIGLPFSTLRDLPPGAFLLVKWSMYIPHL